MTRPHNLLPLLRAANVLDFVNNLHRTSFEFNVCKSKKSGRMNEEWKEKGLVKTK